MRDDLVDVRRALDMGAEANAGDSSGSTALTLAATFGHDALVETLLAKGADINVGVTLSATGPAASRSAPAS